MRVLIVLVLIWLAYRALLTVLYPTTRCRGCDGSGRIYEDRHKQTWRDHRYCDGTGKRPRLGRWVLDRLTRRDR